MIRGVEILNVGPNDNGKGQEGQWNPASGWADSLLR